MDFDRIIERRHTESIKWKYFPEDVLPLWVADMDFLSPPEVIEALHQRVDHGIFGYGIPPQDLSEIVVNYISRHFHWAPLPSQVSYIPGVVTGFNLAIRAFCEPGTSVLFHTPAYPPFFGAPKSAKLPFVTNSLLRGTDGAYSIDFERFEEQIIAERVSVFILCNPQNPTGRVFTREELTRLAEICLRHKVIIISDEIHCDIVYDGRQHIPIASLDAEVANSTLTLMAPSKTYNIAGLYASVAVTSSPELARKFSEVKNGLISGPDLLALTAARAAYLYGDGWLQGVLGYLQANRDWLSEAIARDFPGMRMCKPEGTFLAWLDCRGLNLPLEPQKFFQDRARVGLNSGADYGSEGLGFVRLNFGTQRAVLQEALERMTNALNSL
ncbi:MAG TPA: MalY/PatB family protein [Anaerolineaceae bacterium]|nr:MalY/PatB family protein [Anaerolineaceae bacterium]HPS32501.1 MalY/PatB family protein [Anaerolineaceae bacterium]